MNEVSLNVFWPVSDMARTPQPASAVGQGVGSADSVDSQTSCLDEGSALVSLVERRVRVTQEDYRLWNEHQPEPRQLARRTRSARLVAAQIFRAVDCCLSPKWLLVAASASASLLVVGSVVSMSAMVGGLSGATLLPNVVAGAAASQTGFAVGLGGAVLLSTMGGLLWGCWKGLRFMHLSHEDRLLESYRRAYLEHEKIRREEFSQLGPLSRADVGRQEYLARYMQERYQACASILQSRNLSTNELRKYGLRLQTV
ncbi:MAG: hypothetical protein OXC07_09170 [Kistimonas sp.]|nr:hypothetical protein [Kistimonas sp.]